MLGALLEAAWGLLLRLLGLRPPAAALHQSGAKSSPENLHLSPSEHSRDQRSDFRVCEGISKKAKSSDWATAMEVTPAGGKVVSREESSSMQSSASEGTREIAGRLVHEKSSSMEQAESLHEVRQSSNTQVQSSSSRSVVQSSSVMQSSSFSSSSVMESVSSSSISSSESLLSSAAARALEEVKRLELDF